MGSRVAIVGAGGFVGARLLSHGIGRNDGEVIAVVRSLSSVARVANLGAAYRVADAEKPEALTRAFAGCDVVVNLSKPSPDRIVPTTATCYRAAVAARARLFVHFSSGAVYAPVSRRDLPDDAPARRDLWMAYAREKARADEFLRAQMPERRCAVVVLRPTLIWGPGSPYVLGTAAALVDGSAFIVGDGRGLCDLMYVDDLARMVLAVAAHPTPPSGFYNVGDASVPTWREYYGALAAGLGVDAERIQRVPDRYAVGIRDVLDAFRAGAAYRWLKSRLPLETRAALKRRLVRGSQSIVSGPRTPNVTREMWQLQTTRYRLPVTKFAATFGDTRRTSFTDAVAASLAWARFVGVGEAATAPATAPEQSAEAMRSLA